MYPKLLRSKSGVGTEGKKYYKHVKAKVNQFYPCSYFDAIGWVGIYYLSCLHRGSVGNLKIS